MVEEENLRRTMIKLLLGDLGEKWTVQQAYLETVQRLRKMGNPLDFQNAIFIRDLLAEILEQNVIGEVDFRGLPEFLEAKRKQRGEVQRQEYLAWATSDWTERTKHGKLEIKYPEFTVTPAVLDANFQMLPDWIYLTKPDRIDMIISMPASEHKTIMEWKKELLEAGSHLGEPDVDVTFLSLKEIKWRFNFYSLELREKNGESLHKFLLDIVTQTVNEVGGIHSEICIAKDASTPYHVRLGKETVYPAYHVKLEPSFRKRLLEEVEKKFAKPR